MNSDTKGRLTWDLVVEANVTPDRCNHCGVQHPGMTSHADNGQMRAKGDWTWQRQNCGRLVYLTRATIVARWRRWFDENLESI